MQFKSSLHNTSYFRMKTFRYFPTWHDPKPLYKINTTNFAKTVFNKLESFERKRDQFK